MVIARDSSIRFLIKQEKMQFALMLCTLSVRQIALEIIILYIASS